MRYALVEYSTDSRYPNYRIQIVSSVKKVNTFLDYEPKLTHGEFAEECNNYHNDVRSVYILNEEFRKPTISQLKRMLTQSSTGSIYDPRDTNHVLYNIILKNSERMEMPK